MSDTKMMETERGGENTQYETIKTVTSPTDKQEGQFGDGQAPLAKEPSVSSERGEKTAENMRYGQPISESGFGGKTATTERIVNQGGYGRAEAQEEQMKNTRREQGYGGGNDVRA